jgi:hypothetical protein
MVAIGHRGRSATHAALGAVLLSLALAGPVPAQQAPAAAEAQPAAPQQAPPSGETQPFAPGFLDALGRWFSQSAETVSSGLKGTQDTLTSLGSQAGDAAKGAAGAAKGAADAAAGAAVGAAADVARLPATRVVSGRERCELAPNGAPDCRTAASAVCRTGGFETGTSLDIQSARKCPARLWLSGRAPAEGECAVETFVTRAVCQ